MRQWWIVVVLVVPIFGAIGCAREDQPRPSTEDAFRDRNLLFHAIERTTNPDP